jgi:hypothetical protein
MFSFAPVRGEAPLLRNISSSFARSYQVDQTCQSQSIALLLHSSVFPIMAPSVACCVYRQRPVTPPLLAGMEDDEDDRLIGDPCPPPTPPCQRFRGSPASSTSTIKRIGDGTSASDRNAGVVPTGSTEVNTSASHGPSSSPNKAGLLRRMSRRISHPASGIFRRKTEASFMVDLRTSKDRTRQGLLADDGPNYAYDEDAQLLRDTVVARTSDNLDTICQLPPIKSRKENRRTDIMSIDWHSPSPSSSVEVSRIASYSLT